MSDGQRSGRSNVIIIIIIIIIMLQRPWHYALPVLVDAHSDA